MSETKKLHILASDELTDELTEKVTSAWEELRKTDWLAILISGIQAEIERGDRAAFDPVNDQDMGESMLLTIFTEGFIQGLSVNIEAAKQIKNTLH